MACLVVLNFRTKLVNDLSPCLLQEAARIKWRAEIARPHGYLIWSQPIPTRQQQSYPTAAASAPIACMGHDQGRCSSGNTRVWTHKGCWHEQMVLIHGFRTGGANESGPVWLTEQQFSKIEPHLPADTRGKARVDDRRVISGIVHVLKSGGRWIDAPAEYGPKKTLYNRYVRWAAKGIWVGLFQALAQADGPPDQVLLDSSAVKAHRSAAGGKGGRKIKPSAARAAGARRKFTR